MITGEGRTGLTRVGVNGSHDLSGLGDVDRGSEVLQWDLLVDGSSVEINRASSDIAKGGRFPIIR